MILPARVPRPKEWLRLLAREPFTAALTLLALIYVAAGWSPSSYALVLRNLGVAEDGLIFGGPQPIRSDEFAVWTPTLQAVVANDFGAVNETSLYREPFRNLSSMPLRDWALAFKPQYWAFHLISPARAYSVYHAFHWWALLVGWSLFLRRVGVGRLEAALAAVILWAMPWAQAWWTSLAPVLVGAPWLLLAALSRLAAGWRLLLIGWIAAAWLLDGLFYPPLILLMGGIACLTVVALRPEEVRWRRVGILGVGGALGVAVAASYLRGPILRAAEMQGFGGRNFAGGGVPWQNWWGNLMPAMPYVGWQPIYGVNACESGSGGSLLFLLLLGCVCGTRLSRSELVALLRRSAPLLALGLAASLWMLMPLPAALGKPLLWHLMAPSRLLLVPGLVILLLALLWIPHLRLRWSWARVALMVAVVGAAWWLATPTPFAPGSPLGRIHRNSDLLAIPLLLVLPLVEWLRRRGLGRRRVGEDPLAGHSRSLAPATLLAVAAAANIAWFGVFNPLQSSFAIFADHDSPHLRSLREMAAAHPRGWLVVGDSGAYFGSILNGLGFRSVNHALLAPDVEFFAEIFPQIPPPRLQGIFDRYANIQVASRRPPKWQEVLTEPMVPVGNAVLVPPEPFLPPLDLELTSSSGPVRLPPREKRRRVELEIVAPIDGLRGESRLILHTDPPVVRLVDARRLPVGLGPEVLGADLYSRLLLTVGVTSEEELAWCLTIVGPDGVKRVGPPADEARSTCAVAPLPDGASAAAGLTRR